MSEVDEFSRLNSFKECAVCGAELEKGYLNAPRGAYWCSDKHRFGLVLLDSVMPGALWTQDVLPALKCEKCGILFVDYRAPGYTPKSFLKKCVQCNKQIPIASEYCPLCGREQKQKAGVES